MSDADELPPAGEPDERPSAGEPEEGGAMHPWRSSLGGPPITARTALLMVAMVFVAGVAVGYLLGRAG